MADGGTQPPPPPQDGAAVTEAASSILPVGPEDAAAGSLAAAWGAASLSAGRSERFHRGLQRLGEAVVLLQECHDAEIDTAALTAYYQPLKRFVADKQMRAWMKDDKSVVSLIPTSTHDQRRLSTGSPTRLVRSSHKRTGTRCHCGKILPLDYITLYHDGRINELALIDLVPYFTAHALEADAKHLSHKSAAELVVKHIRKEEEQRRRAMSLRDDATTADTETDMLSMTSYTTLSFELVEECRSDGSCASRSSLEYNEESMSENSPGGVASRRRRTSRRGSSAAALADGHRRSASGRRYSTATGRSSPAGPGANGRVVSRRFEAKVVRRHVDPAAAAAAREARQKRRQRLFETAAGSSNSGGGEKPPRMMRQASRGGGGGSNGSNAAPRAGGRRGGCGHGTSPRVGSNSPGVARGHGGPGAHVAADGAGTLQLSSPASNRTGSPGGAGSPRTGDEGAAGYSSAARTKARGSGGAAPPAVPPIAGLARSGSGMKQRKGGATTPRVIRPGAPAATTPRSSTAPRAAAAAGATTPKRGGTVVTPRR